MQRGSCDDIGLLISKYVDGEANPAEREAVDLHVAACAGCAGKLTEYMEFAAIFAEAPVRAPQPELRAGVFHEVGQLKEDARRKERVTPARGLWRGLFPRVGQQAGSGAGAGLGWGRVWEVASPFAALGLAVFALMAVVMVNGNRGSNPTPTGEPIDASFYPPVPTIPATMVSAVILNGAHTSSVSGVPVPPPLGTKLANVPAVPEASVVVQTSATVGGDLILNLEHPTPVMEGGTAWHALRDPAYGYSIFYPTNWWTQVQGDTRLFFPWSPGGTKYAPYWIDMRVQPNPQHLDATRARAVLFNGQGQLEGTGSGGPLWLRQSGGDDNIITDEIYAFDNDSIYALRLSVPLSSLLGDFPSRWSTAEDIFSHMSRRVSLGAQAGRVLFLNGGDLWSVGAADGSPDAKPVWRGYGTRWVHQFEASPEGHTVAVGITDDQTSPWAKEVYLGQLDGNSTGAPLLMSAAEIHDIAWYSDRDLLVIAKTAASGLGIYRLTVVGAHVSAAPTPQLLVKLGDDMAGARGILVSPDRQLISFLAPLGEDKGTDVYAVRPDGSNLVKVVSHAQAVSPDIPGVGLLSADDQAVKSYLWTQGSLEPSGYAYNMLYTCGNSSSPTLYRGGFLYAAAGAPSGPLLDPARLQVADPASVQIVHVAYSPSGKVALSGFYSLKSFKVETLAGLWTADLQNGQLTHLQTLPLLDTSHGVSDLQWSPDGKSLVYRETVSDQDSLSSRYDGHLPFSMVKVNVATGEKAVLYEGSSR